MSGLETFLDSYGLAAACGLMLVKAIGVPIPIPGDVILLGVAARAAEGKLLLWVAFVGLLVAVSLGGWLQFFLARGPARAMVMRYGARLGLTPERLDAVAKRVRQGGPLAIGLGVLTPGLRTAVIPACGLTDVPLATFLPGLLVGSAIDLAIHFTIGYVGSSLFTVSPVAVLAVVAIAGLAVALYIARRRQSNPASAVTAWTQATCPLCLALEVAVPATFDPAVRWESAA
jgi:membrane protein DedA with SNARE-associated domain